MLLFLACTAPKDPPHSEAPPDTSPDTSPGESSPETSAETSPETSPETSLETGPPETAETAYDPPCDSPSATGWAEPTFVDSDLAGWPDADCSEPTPGRSLTFTLPTPLVVEARFLAGQATPGPHQLLVQLRDCDRLPCPSTVLDVGLPHVAAALDASGARNGADRGLGYWGPDGAWPRRVAASGRNHFLLWSNDGTEVCSAVTVCLERVRPDEIRGVVRAESTGEQVWGGGVGNLMAISFYETVVFRHRFTIQFDDHAGFDSTEPDNGKAPSGYATARYVYDIPYEDAWPWAALEDPKAAAALYTRFTPYNAP